MRFHFGMSFSWRTIKKYLIPILLGVLAYFGFNFLYDNTSIPPIGIINVYASENDDYNDISSSDIPDEVQDNYNYWSSILSNDSYIAEEVNHKPIYDKIYWFDDNSSEIGVLSSIYILLFIYCFTMIIFKILELINKKRW